MRRCIHLMMALVFAGCASERATPTARTRTATEIAADVAAEGSVRRAHEALARGRALRDELRFPEALAAFDQALAADPTNDDARRERERTALVLEPGDPAIVAKLRAAFEGGCHRKRLVPEDELAAVRWLIDDGRRGEALARVERLREWLRWFPFESRDACARADDLYLEAKKTPER
jgi:tetratricopeptide (TPR) repeat protein